MPSIQVAPVDRDRAILVVGNGPSGKSRLWPHVWRWLAAAGGRLPDLLLINRSAMGPTVPAYAVACDTDMLKEMQRRRLHHRTCVLCNSVENTCGPDYSREGLDELFDSPNNLRAPDHWPALASGPLSVWMAAAMGYGTIYIYALDGTARPFPDDQDEIERRARTWEHMTRRFMEARGDAGGEPRLVRVWPRADVPASLRDRGDPLGKAVAETMLAP